MLLAKQKGSLDECTNRYAVEKLLWPKAFKSNTSKGSCWNPSMWSQGSMACRLVDSWNWIQVDAFALWGHMYWRLSFRSFARCSYKIWGGCFSSSVSVSHHLLILNSLHLTLDLPRLCPPESWPPRHQRWPLWPLLHSRHEVLPPLQVLQLSLWVRLWARREGGDRVVVWGLQHSHSFMLSTHSPASVVSLLFCGFFFWCMFLILIFLNTWQSGGI